MLHTAIVSSLPSSTLPIHHPQSLHTLELTHGTIGPHAMKALFTTTTTTSTSYCSSLKVLQLSNIVLGTCHKDSDHDDNDSSSWKYFVQGISQLLLYSSQELSILTLYYHHRHHNGDTTTSTMTMIGDVELSMLLSSMTNTNNSNSKHSLKELYLNHLPWHDATLQALGYYLSQPYCFLQHLSLDHLILMSFFPFHCKCR